MKSPYLEDFLKNVGYSVHNINTICVGLSCIEEGKYKKPKSLTITWSTTDNVSSARKARSFALKSSLIYIDDALSIYLKEISSISTDPILNAILKRKNPQFVEAISTIFQKKYIDLFKIYDKKNEKAKLEGEKDKEYRNLDGADRLRGLNHILNFEYKYWIPCIVLLNKWRNKVAHQISTAQLEQNEIDILVQSSPLIKMNHSNIDISKTLEDFNTNKITLKDITTLIAITIKAVREIDKQVYSSINNINLIEGYVKSKKLVEKYNAIVGNQNPIIRKRKFLKFVTSNITHIENSVIEYLYEELRIIESEKEE